MARGRKPKPIRNIQISVTPEQGIRKVSAEFEVDESLFKSSDFLLSMGFMEPFSESLKAVLVDMVENWNLKADEEIRDIRQTIAEKRSRK